MIKVIGAGFGRTGTHSLGLALETLGFGPCYNILEIARNPGHAEIWYDALSGRSVDWEALFKDYQSSVEWPAVAFLPELVRNFPQTKVVLTLREAESWYESANATIFEGLELSAYNPDPAKREYSGISRRLILERTFGNRQREKDHALKVYRRHQQLVLETVPPQRLLQYDIKDGWEPLCAFLDKPVPDEQFPKVNERSTFLASEPEWAKKIKREQKK